MVIIARGEARATIDAGEIRDVVGWPLDLLNALASSFPDGGPQDPDEDLSLALYLCTCLAGATVIAHEEPPFDPDLVY